MKDVLRVPVCVESTPDPEYLKKLNAGQSNSFEAFLSVLKDSPFSACVTRQQTFIRPVGDHPILSSIYKKCSLNKASLKLIIRFACSLWFSSETKATSFVQLIKYENISEMFSRDTTAAVILEVGFLIKEKLILNSVSFTTTNIQWHLRH